MLGKLAQNYVDWLKWGLIVTYAEYISSLNKIAPRKKGPYIVGKLLTVFAIFLFPTV